MTQSFEHSFEIPFPQENVEMYFGTIESIERLTPPWQKISKLQVNPNNEIAYILKEKALPPTKVKLKKISPSPSAVSYTQHKGTYKSWHQDTNILTSLNNSTRVNHHIEYKLPFSRLFHSPGEKEVVNNLTSVFEYQKSRMTIDLTRFHQSKAEPLTIAITGATGLIGRELTTFLRCIGHTVITIGRRENSDIIWDPDNNTSPSTDQTANILIHLAGENISAKRWTKKQKSYLIKNRKQTVTAATYIAKELNVKTLIVASAVGYYGNQPQKALTEESPQGSLFASQLCQAIEETAKENCPQDIRLITPRLGAVLSPQGGALKRMLLPFKLGLGGPVGSGAQHMPWISLDDTVGGLYHLITTSKLEGPVNLTAPQSTTFKNFATELGKALKRPAFAPFPAFMAKLIFGEMAENVLLADTQVIPQKLQADGYKFLCPTLASALRWQLFGRGPISL